MVGAAEELARIAVSLAGDARALVRTSVVQHSDASVGMPHHQHGLQADRRAVEVAGIRGLAVVADVDPRIGEDVSHLELEDFVVDIDVAMHFGFAHQRTDRVDVPRITRHGRLPRRAWTGWPGRYRNGRCSRDYAEPADAAIDAPAIARADLAGPCPLPDDAWPCRVRLKTPNSTMMRSLAPIGLR